MKIPSAPITFWIGAGLSAGLVLTALISLIFTPFDPTEINIGNRFQPPSLIHGFGTDHLGRDVLSMIMQGAQVSVAVAVIAVSIGMIIGIPLGLIAAAYKGLPDTFLMRANDIVFAFPAVILAILITAVLGPSAINAILAIGVFNIPVFARITRGGARALWQREFILSARVLGKSHLQISVEHVLPNLSGLILVQATIQFALAIAAESALSYIGLGVQPPAPSWGRMLYESQTLFSWGPWLTLFPGLAILVSVMGLNLLGDGLRDLLDPRMQSVKAKP